MGAHGAVGSELHQALVPQALFARTTTVMLPDPPKTEITVRYEVQSGAVGVRDAVSYMQCSTP